MIGPNEVSILDENSEALGIETSDLMKNAGGCLAGEIMKRYPTPSRAIFFCGTGNNGGDGFVAARILAEADWKVSVILSRSVERIGSDLALSAFKSLEGYVDVNVALDDWEAVEDLLWESDVIVDGLLGAGARGAPRGVYIDLVKAMNGSDSPVVSIDIPTGAGFEPHVNAELTVTFHDSKTNMFKNGKPLEECGEIVVADIGIPLEASTFVGPGDLSRYPKTREMAKKGDGGKALVIGGGPFTGAPALASLAAGRSGSDLVRVAVPERISQVIASFSPDLIVQGIGGSRDSIFKPGMVEKLRRPIKWADAVLIGPGAGDDPETLEALYQIVKMSLEEGKRIVVDADGITAIARFLTPGKPISESPDRILITPHRGELKRILEALDLVSEEADLSEPYIMDSGVPVDIKEEVMEAVSSLCYEHKFEVLLKGPLDAIFTSGDHTLGSLIDAGSKRGDVKMRLNSAGVPSMSTGGTGDVLAGICVGLASRGMSLFDSACLASYLNGKAGEESYATRGHSMVASDLLDHIRILP